MNIAILIVTWTLVLQESQQQQTQQQQTQQQQQQQQQRQQQEREQQERERLRRANQELAARTRNRDMIDAGGNVVRPGTEAERLKLRKQRLDSFVKDVERFRQASDQIAATQTISAAKASAKALEDRIPSILFFMLDGTRAPAPPKIDYEQKTFEEQLRLLCPLAQTLALKLQQLVEDEKKNLFDSKLWPQVIQDLQSVRLVARAVRQTR